MSTVSFKYPLQTLNIGPMVGFTIYLEGGYGYMDTAALNVISNLIYQTIYECMNEWHGLDQEFEWGIPNVYFLIP